MYNSYTICVQVVKVLIFKCICVNGVYPKDNIEWLNWIAQEKALYINKKKIQKIIDIQGMNYSEPTYLDLNLVTKIIKDFKNPNI